MIMSAIYTVLSFILIAWLAHLAFNEFDGGWAFVSFILLLITTIIAIGATVARDKSN